MDTGPGGSAGTTRPLVRSLLAGLAVVAAVALVYAAFLGWDRERDVDAATGATTGPYGTAQVLACGLAFLLVVALGAVRAPGASAVAGVLTFTLLWSLDAATRPDADGLWPIGAVMVLIGTSTGAVLAVALGPALVRWSRRAGPPAGVS